MNMTLNAEGSDDSDNEDGEEIPFVLLSGNKIVQPRQSMQSDCLEEPETPVRRQSTPSVLPCPSPPFIKERNHSFDETRSGNTGQVVPHVSMMPRSVSTPIMPHLCQPTRQQPSLGDPPSRPPPMEAVRVDEDVIIPSKASSTLGASQMSESYLDDRPMSPLRAGAKALKLLGGLEDSAIMKNKARSSSAHEKKRLPG